jgi:lysophospholipase L1-like esterase
VLSYNGLDAVFMRELLTHLLDERHLQIGRVVIEAYCINAVSGSELRDYRLFNDSPPRLKMRLLTLLRSLGALSWNSAYELLALGGNETLLTAPVLNPLVIDPSSRHGAYRGKNAPGLSAEEFAVLERFVPAEVEPAIHPLQRAAWEDIFALVREHGLAVDFVEVPMPAPITMTPAVAGARRELSALLASHGFHYVDLSEQGLFDAADPALFTDWNHLSTDGRDAYSRAFAAWLQREPLAPSR